MDFAKTSEIRQKKLSARLRHCYHYLQPRVSQGETMRKTKEERDRWNTYMRDYRAKLKAAKEVLSKSVHSGITVSVVTGPDGQSGLNIVAKFNQSQLDALEELARWEHTDAETMVQDMLLQAGLEWRRIRDDRNERRKAMTLEEMDQKETAYRERLEELRGDLL